MSKILLSFVSIAIILMGPACSHPDESTLPLHAPGWSTPVVTGLRITGLSGPLQIAAWGVPSDPAEDPPQYFAGGGEADTIVPEPGPIPRKYSFGIPYPNPHSGAMTMSYALPTQSLVDLWVVRARWVGSTSNDIVSLGGSTVPAPDNRAVKVLLHNHPLSAGYFQHTWDDTDDGGVPLPAGFYRIYFQANNFTSWRDVFIYRSWDDLPSSLRDMLTHG